MQKKKITAFLLALAMVSAMALPVFAQEPNPQAETAASIAVVETATPETAATEEPKVDAEPAEDNVKEDAATYDAPPENGWYQEYPGGPWYWYENGVRQGTTGRGKEIYDPKSDAWYWLDAVQGGAMTTNKDVYQDSNGGKWVRYDANGHMVKGWDTNEKGTYYFDLVTGAMAKGMCTIDGIPCAFDTTTGIGLDKQWVNINGGKFWYEGGKRQGTTGRGKEIYDPKSDAWYWLDAVQGGAMTTNKDVYQDSNGGKWVRYDANGHMVKGWDTNEKGTYYFDLVTGAMAKGMCTIDGIPCAFDTTTGIGLDKQWVNINGGKFWYEGGKRQGTTGRGKEIYDPASDAWYWLDSVNNGAMAVSKDVYQDSNGGKWVRYDANGHMIKGWNTNSQGTYYFDLITGAMAKGTVVIDGITCVFDYNTGILQSTNVDVTKYREIKRTNYYADGSVMNTLTTDYDAQGRLLKEQRRDKSGNLQVQDDFYYEYNGMLTKHTHREYGNDNYSYEYRYEYDKSNRFAKISVYRYNGGWYLYSYWTAKEWDSLGSVSKFWEYNGQNKVTCIVNLTSSGSRNRYTKMTIVNSSNKTVRTDTWSYDSNGHLAGWTNSGNSNGYSNVLRLSSDNNIGAGNPLFDRHCGKFVTDDKITSASIKFQNDEVVEIRQNNQRISYTNQESMGMNSSNNLTRTFATYTDGGNFRYRTLVEYFKYKN